MLDIEEVRRTEMIISTLRASIVFLGMFTPTDGRGYFITALRASS